MVFTKNFSLICMERTGSNFISEYLDSSKELRVYNELFHRSMIIFDDGRISESPQLLSNRDQNPEAFLSRVWNGEFESEELRKQYSGFGFKIFLNHNARALKYIVNRGNKIVYLTRRSALSRFSSFKIAEKTGEWKTRKGQDAKKKKIEKIEFFPSEFRAYYQNYRTLETLFEMTLTRWNVSYHPIVYEDFFSQEVARKGIAEYLQIDSSSLKEPDLKQQNTADTIDRFSNPEEVVKFMTENGLELI